MTGAAALSNAGAQFGTVLMGMCVQHWKQVFVVKLFSNDCRMLADPGSSSGSNHPEGPGVITSQASMRRRTSGLSFKFNSPRTPSEQPAAINNIQ
jgi:hypothetical protein